MTRTDTLVAATINGGTLTTAATQLPVTGMDMVTTPITDTGITLTDTGVMSGESAGAGLGGAAASGANTIVNR